MIAISTQPASCGHPQPPLSQGQRPPREREEFLVILYGLVVRSKIFKAEANPSASHTSQRATLSPAAHGLSGSFDGRRGAV